MDQRKQIAPLFLYSMAFLLSWLGGCRTGNSDDLTIETQRSSIEIVVLSQGAFMTQDQPLGVGFAFGVDADGLVTAEFLFDRSAAKKGGLSLRATLPLQRVKELLYLSDLVCASDSSVWFTTEYSNSVMYDVGMSKGDISSLGTGAAWVNDNQVVPKGFGELYDVDTGIARLFTSLASLDWDIDCTIPVAHLAFAEKLGFDW